MVPTGADGEPTAMRKEIDEAYPEDELLPEGRA
jgi:hypothetical protein